jgi:membrane protease YdiL (CAAX protease family)
MGKVIRKIRETPYLNVLVAVSMGWFVILLSKFSANPVANIIGSYLPLDFYTKNVIFKFFMLLFSTGIILLINRGNMGASGFTWPVRFSFLRSGLITAGIVLATLITANVIFRVILGHLFPTVNTTGFPAHKSMAEMILTVWIWSSICEEVLVRGLVQSFIRDTGARLFRLSLPVIISGLFFGSMHLMLFSAGMGLWFVCTIVFFTTAIGLLAASYREKSGSLVPAVWVHFVANIIGSLPLIVMAILHLSK